MERSTTPSSTGVARHVGFDIDIEEVEESFCIQDVPNKGKGIVSLRPIKRGELILTEPPLFSLPTDPTNSAVLVALSQCSRAQQEDFFALSNSFKGELLPALGIFESNALLFTSEDPHRDTCQERAGIFLFASHFNNSCAPNISKAWDDVQQIMLFRALCDIEEGEELCFNYAAVLGTKEQRRRDILEEYNFECRCDVCELEAEELEQSDGRRVDIARLFDEVSGCRKDLALGVNKVKSALKLLKAERLVHYEASFCYDAFQLCVSVSDFDNAKLWIRRAWEVICCISGPDSDASKAFKMYWANPRTHQLAGASPSMTLSGPE